MCKVFQNECTRYVFKSILKLLLAIWRSCSVHCVKLWWMSFGFDKQLWCKIKIFGEVKASSFLRYGFTIIVFPFYWKLLKFHMDIGYSTICDFHNFGLIFAGIMHCLPQRLKHFFYTPGTLRAPSVRKNFKQRWF